LPRHARDRAGRASIVALGNHIAPRFVVDDAIEVNYPWAVLGGKALLMDRMGRAAMAAWLLATPAVPAAIAAGLAEPVEFSSRDGSTRLVGYLFMPASMPPWPAVVMLHGRSGSYSQTARVYDAGTLSMRHKQWGEFWADRGYLALHVDSFGPRGYPRGFPFGSYSSRPPEVSEQTVRPLDAYGALDYLRSRSDVIKDRIGLHGWSNGAMTGLASLAAQPPGMKDPTPASGFRAAVLFYPGCRAQLKEDYRPYTPTVLLIGSEDEEVAAIPCRQLAEQIKARGVSHFELVWYVGATHSFDDPGKPLQSIAANRSARSDSMRRAEAFFRQHLQE
jgi:carboxymethylenebutenolidase